MLCVADWGQSLSFYNMQGKQVCQLEVQMIIYCLRDTVLPQGMWYGYGVWCMGEGPFFNLNKEKTL